MRKLRYSIVTQVQSEADINAKKTRFNILIAIDGSKLTFAKYELLLSILRAASLEKTTLNK